MRYESRPGVPAFDCAEFHEKRRDYALLIPVINEKGRLEPELRRAKDSGVDAWADVVICDGGSTDGSTEETLLESLAVNSLLVKRGPGKQGAQLRMGLWWALERGYKGVITVDGNNKDSVEDVPRFIEKLEQGYDLVQGSRFLKGGQAVNTPLIRLLAVRLLHAPVISLTAGQRFTDTTNAFRGYSAAYLRDGRVQPLREIFTGYELLAYLSVRATQLGYKACEIPVSRVYPKEGKTPTKISFFKGNADLLKVLFLNLFGAYKPKEGEKKDRRD